MSRGVLPRAVALEAVTLEGAWEPIKVDLVQRAVEEPLRIRVHRALRALEQAEVRDAQGTDSGSDAGLVLRWVALSSLY